MLILFLALVPSRDLTLSLALRLMSIRILLPVKGERGACFFCPVVSTLVVEEVPCHASRLGRVAGGVAAAEALSCNARICREPLRVWRLPIVWNEVDHTQDRSCLYKDIQCM